MDHDDNPLLGEWTAPFGAPPFDALTAAHALDALRAGMQEQRREVEAIATSEEAPTFANTLEALERSGRTLARVAHAFFAVHAAHSDEGIRATARTISPELARHQDAIRLDARLCARIRTIHDQREALDLDPEQRRLLEETHKEFVRAGAALPEAAQTRLREINQRLAEATQQFGENLLAETNDFDLHVTDEAALGPLPTSLRAAAADEARRRGHDGGWSFTLQRPSLEPFLECSPDRALRRRIFEAYAARGDRGNEHDNNALVTEIAELRAERARLLGHPTHAHYVLSDNMAGTPERVRELLERVWEPARAQAERERDDLRRRMNDEGVDGELRPWDWFHYAAKLRRERFDLDEERTRPYFEFASVRDGCFAVAERLFGLQLRERGDVPTWHPDQQVFEVTEEDGAHVGLLYMDFFARPSKKAGAWMTQLRAQEDLDGPVTPLVTTNFNFPPPSAESPSLLSFDEATTLFHEFGHALHGLLSRVRYRSLSGTNVPRDFVEFPSQLLENWCREPEGLRLFARHHVTGLPIDEELLAALRESARFGQGFATVEYLAASFLDLAWHTLEHGAARIEDPAAFEAREMERIGLIDAILPRYRTPAFAHVFSGGYAAGYYGYLWAEVLDADGFEAFREAGLFDRELAGRLRELLARGGSAAGMELYRAFRGRDPEIGPLLARRGLVVAGEHGED